jgi:signal transduction histidine kinase
VNTRPGALNQVRRSLFTAALVLLVESAGIAAFALSAKRRKRGDAPVRGVTEKLIQAVEDERKHIARELHDDIGQRLSLIALQLDSLSQLKTRRDSGYKTSLRDALLDLESVITDVHNLSHSLHSSELDHLGLEAALRELCLKISKRHGIEVRLKAEQIPEDLDSEVALCFYRVAQEALSNVVKHSRSSRAELTVALQGRELRMQIADFGVGYDAEVVPVGLGLATMQERLVALAGACSSDSKPGVGTTVTAEAPIRRHAPMTDKQEMVS